MIDWQPKWCYSYDWLTAKVMLQLRLIDSQSDATAMIDWQPKWCYSYDWLTAKVMLQLWLIDSQSDATATIDWQPKWCYSYDWLTAKVMLQLWLIDSQSDATATIDWQPKWCYSYDWLTAKVMLPLWLIDSQSDATAMIDWQPKWCYSYDWLTTKWWQIQIRMIYRGTFKMSPYPSRIPCWNNARNRSPSWGSVPYVWRADFVATIIQNTSLIVWIIVNMCQSFSHFFLTLVTYVWMCARVN